MIPTIEQIVKDLAAGSITQEQAIAWLEEHVRLAEESARMSAAIDAAASH